MATTCQTILDRARGLNGLNPSIVTTAPDILSRIRHDQQDVFTQAANVNREYFQHEATVTSSSAASARTLSLATLGDSPTFKPVERLLDVKLPSGVSISQVDQFDVEAEYAPRYYVRGRTLCEVSNDWGAAGSVACAVVYVYGMIDIDPFGATSYAQPVTVPDQWTELLELALGIYLFEKDPGRDEAEYTRLVARLGDWAKRTGRRGAFLDYLANVGGQQYHRFNIPSPREIGPS